MIPVESLRRGTNFGKIPHFGHEPYVSPRCQWGSLSSSLAIFQRPGRRDLPNTLGKMSIQCFLNSPWRYMGYMKNRLALRGAPGSPISSLHLLHDTFHCIASSARLDLDDPDAPSLTEKWPNSNLDFSPFPRGKPFGILHFTLPLSKGDPALILSKPLPSFWLGI